jgi:hypothetical protein
MDTDMEAYTVKPKDGLPHTRPAERAIAGAEPVEHGVPGNLYMLVAARETRKAINTLMWISKSPPDITCMHAFHLCARPLSNFLIPRASCALLSLFM